MLGGSSGQPGAYSAGGSITISWQAPMRNNDGTPLVDLAGYRIYYGQTPGSYESLVRITNVGVMTYVLDGLSPGTYYLVMTSVNSAGLESAPSAEFSRTVG